MEGGMEELFAPCRHWAAAAAAAQGKGKVGTIHRGASAEEARAAAATEVVRSDGVGRLRLPED